MKEVSLTEMHQLQLRIMDCIHEYCVSNNIRYSLGGGTLLGAIRHKGFIPWDDDMDIMMPRPDYERFIKGFHKQYNYCEVQHWRYDKSYYLPWAKVYDNRTVLQEKCLRTGVYIDIFPIDGIPSEEHHDQYARGYGKRAWRPMVFTRPFRERPFKWKIVSLILLPKNFFHRLCDSYLMQYDFETSPCTGCTTGSYGKLEYMGPDTFKKYIDMDFEGRKLKAIAEYDAYLTKHYGDYMQLPPEEKQVSHHKYECWWKDGEN